MGSNPGNLLKSFLLYPNAIPDNLTASNLTPNTPVIHTSFTYSKLNMDDLFVLTGPLGYVDCIQEVELKSLHAHGHFCY